MLGFVAIFILLSSTFFTFTVKVVSFPPYVTFIVCVPALVNFVGVQLYPLVIVFVVPLLYVAVKTKPVVFNSSPSKYSVLLGFVVTFICDISLVNIISAEHPEKALSSIVAAPGALISSNLVQLLNIYAPIYFTVSGIVIFVKLLHPSNAEFLISVTLAGIVILLKLLHPIKQ